MVIQPQDSAPVVDPVHDIFRLSRKPLDGIFAPRSVAVIGATEKVGSVGRTILWNLITHPFGGTVYPINPKRPQVLGVRAYPSIKDVPETVDLAVIVTPAPTVPGLIGDCIAQGVRGVVIISAGFKERGAEGLALERQIMDKIAGTQMRIIGPNCLGVMMPLTGLNATFATEIANPGNVGFISQSGALCTAVLDWSLEHNVGFSAFISIGSMMDVDWGDLIHYLGDDPNTKSIVIYMESVGNARSFLSAAREVALTKPIIVIKAGRTAAAAKAAASHTGALAGSDAVLEAAFARSGVVRVMEIGDLFYMADVFSKQPRPKGPNLTIITNAGGPGVLATDTLVTGGGALAELSAETMDKLNKILPESWSHNNPVDVIGDADPERYAKAAEIAAKDPSSDGVLVILTPQDMTDPTGIAERIRPMADLGDKPILASWMGGAAVAKGISILDRAGIPTFAYPDTACRAFNYMWRYSYNLQGLYETPSLSTIEDSDGGVRSAVKTIIDQVLADGRSLLTEHESKALLAAYGIPTVPTVVATTEDEAVVAAAKIGYPTVLKLNSQTISHKTDVGGVQLNLVDEAGVRRAWNLIKTTVAERAGAQHFQGVTVQPMAKLKGYELIIGSSIDSQFGPVLLFGAGGQLVEVNKDTALALPPLTNTLARRLMAQTRVWKALQGVRGEKGVDMAALESLLVRFSLLVAEQPRIKEIDINPLLASSERLVALDARVVLHEASIPDEKLPKLAIRPYPKQYIFRWRSADGQNLTLRPMRPDDESLLVKFHEELSEATVKSRYMHAMDLKDRIAHERLMRICFIDYDREIPLAAVERDAKTGQPAIVGIAHLRKMHGINEADFVLIAIDRWQGKGLGTKLLQELIGVARAEGLDRLVCAILPDGKAMQDLCVRLGFQLSRDEGKNLVTAVLDLKA
jgi:acetyltransferase